MHDRSVTEPFQLGADFLQDPHGVCAALRDLGPVREVVTPRGQRMWMVTRHADARAALTSPDLSKDIHLARRTFDPVALAVAGLDFGSDLSSHMLNTDPPDHTRLRRLVNKAFMARGVKGMRPRIEAIADELLDEMAGHEEVDLLSAFAFPLPITVICELLGVPEMDRGDFRAWSTTIVTATSPEELTGAAGSMVAYLSGLIEGKKVSSGNDLLIELIRARDADDRLSATELVSMAFLLLVAGHETTVNLIGNAIIALHRDPGQLAALLADPTLVPGAVEELLRYDGPVNLATVRFTVRPTSIGGTEIPAGQFVLISLGSANRDETRFADADELRVTRDPTGHLAFGYGAHHCVGAPLARLEIEVALGALLRRFPELEVLGDGDGLRWRDSMLIRGVETLPVRPGPSRKPTG
ncbi:cytochrome P450 family protein [Streptosporangium sp. OZ121]|uniref:cytochrome P450 family protein n=1 Tax=Streptosporangium sp. OZ121 TaxID=3444183 RepID=UPI003F7954CC